MKLLLLTLSFLAQGTFADDLSPLKIHEGLLANENKMTVYVFDRDKDGIPTCYAGCATIWPPVLFPEGEVKAPLSIVVRKDQTRQIAYKGKPLYLYADDESPGDTNGDGISGIWHIIRP